MIQKFVRITNVGKFRNCKPVGDVGLSRLTLVYAENGRGKTTLCDILRSLRTGNGDLIRGRATLGPRAAISIDIRLDGANALFDGSQWSATFPALWIFDSRFVHQNVYSGESVAHEQKRNLYRVIVGEKGVELARQVDALDSKIRDADAAIKEARARVAHLTPASLSVDTYVKLKQDPGIEQKLASKEREVVALRRADEISSHPLLEPIQVPTLPSTLPTVLAKEVDGVSMEAEKLLKGHLAEHTTGATQAWLAQGVSFERGEECPYCQQSVKANELLAAYRGLFGDSYRRLKGEVESVRAGVDALDATSTRVRLAQVLQSNKDRVGFWKQFLTVDEARLDLNDLLDSMKLLRDHAARAVATKAATILEAVTLDSDFEAASVRFEAALASVEAYNAAVNERNAAISEKKGQIKAGDLAQSDAALVRLRATKDRQRPAAVALCDLYLQAVETKKELVTAKSAAKRELDQHSAELLGIFQRRINQLLEMVTAGFRLTNIAREYKGRSPRSTYQVLINDVAVSLGDEKTPPSEPSFRNTLSSGDRSTLALAFFFAQLELDPNLEEKVVVLDDPFTSQDLSRRTWTQQRISRIARRAKQVIVLSHEPSFLRPVYDASPSALTKCLQFCRLGQEDTTITEYDITEATRGDYYKDHAVLTQFLNDGEGKPKDVTRAIRPVLEAYFRFKFPGLFDDKEWLGDFISKMRNAVPGTALAQAPPELIEALEDINDYSKRYHHTNASVDKEPIDDGELTSYVRRTLMVVGGF